MTAEFTIDLEQFAANARQALLALRHPQGHWEGQLSSSALSTATAVMALEEHVNDSGSRLQNDRAESLKNLVTRGRDWLASAQNADGGWGDTLDSKSNISTTALVWGALVGDSDAAPEVVARCERWLSQAAGGELEPAVLARAIADRYGADRTFSVPILTALALRGRLGDPKLCWKLIPQLPFELAAFPHRWFARLRLPVVSYALPALISMGLARHRRRRSANPLASGLRDLFTARTLRVLQEIQPQGGGFLEATPLTSFVTLSMIGAGEGAHPVVQEGIGFLVRSVRSDGSWPIDTNLATWVTTLSINALATFGPGHFDFSADEAQMLAKWLRSQQLSVEHPYTHAAPGGWAWTDLAGGVPDADDTPGALLALWNLAGVNAASSAAAGVKWLVDLQNADGGIPTFCRGWGTLPFDRSSPDLTAHALRAWSTWNDYLPSELKTRVHVAAARALGNLTRTQRPDGAWAPLWFGNQHDPNEQNLVYGTSRVLLALASPALPGTSRQTQKPNMAAAISWLLSAQNVDGGWGSSAQVPSSIEETALAVDALAAVAHHDEVVGDARHESILRGVQWLADKTRMGREFPPSPIGFYFAKLWYHEKLYPICFTLAALGRTSQIVKRPRPDVALQEDAAR